MLEIDWVNGCLLTKEKSCLKKCLDLPHSAHLFRNQHEGNEFVFKTNFKSIFPRRTPKIQVKNSKHVMVDGWVGCGWWTGWRAMVVGSAAAAAAWRCCEGSSSLRRQRGASAALRGTLSGPPSCGHGISGVGTVGGLPAAKSVSVQTLGSKKEFPT